MKFMEVAANLGFNKWIEGNGPHVTEETQLREKNREIEKPQSLEPVVTASAG